LRVKGRLLRGWWSSVGTGLRGLGLRTLRLGGKRLQASLKDLVYTIAISHILTYWIEKKFLIALEF